MTPRLRESARTLLAIAVLGLAASSLQAATPSVKVDQVGYLPWENPKLAMITTGAGNLNFHVIAQHSGVTVYSGVSSAVATDTGASCDLISTADFTSVTTSGDF